MWPRPPQGGASPNVAVIVLDDIGFGHLGCYGSSIETPNIDRLCNNGLQYTNFQTAALCSPTRGALLTGRNHHSIGLGIITEGSTGFPGYNGQMPKEAATIAEVLKQEGYSTMALGKWHNTPTPETSASGPFDRWPLGMGFEKFYGFLGAETNQWMPDLVSDNHRIPPPHGVPGYHFSEDLVNKTNSWIAQQQGVTSDKPFFLWMAFGAAHSPHHAPKSYIEKYKGRFDHGWDEERERVLQRQKDIGVVPDSTVLTERDSAVPAWQNVTERQKIVYSRMQEIFAGFVEHTDAQIGAFLDNLEELGVLDETMIVLVSDNGASQEGGPNGLSNENRYFNGLPESIDELHACMEDLGGPNTYGHYPWGWASVGNTPFQRYKQNVHAGGVTVPMIVHWPNGVSQPGIRNQFHYATDLVPTLLEALEVEMPKEVNGATQMPLEGVSMLYSFSQPDEPTHKDIQYFEIIGCRGLWKDGWKAVTYHQPQSGGNFHEDKWELYHVDEDVAEAHNLAEEFPDKLQELVELWWVEAGKHNVLPLDDRTYERARVRKPRIATVKPVFTYYPDSEDMPFATTPYTIDRSHTIDAVVTLTSESEGVLYSMGDLFGGYALYIKDGHFVYHHNVANKFHWDLLSAGKVTPPDGESVDVTLKFDFERTEKNKGIGRLYLDDVLVGERAFPVLTPFTFGLKTAGRVGRFGGTSVEPSLAAPFTFSGGRIRAVHVSTEDTLALRQLHLET